MNKTLLKIQFSLEFKSPSLHSNPRNQLILPVFCVRTFKHDILKPKTNLIVSKLRIHNTDILSKYNIVLNDMHNVVMPRNKVFIIVPFYKNIHNLSNLYKDFLYPFLKNCAKEEVQEFLANLDIVISYKNTNNLSKYLV